MVGAVPVASLTTASAGNPSAAVALVRLPTLYNNTNQKLDADWERKLLSFSI
jgi:hypothetical protein